MTAQQPPPDPLFDACVEYVLRLEGSGDVARDPSDPGGVTRWGIASSFYPNIDVTTLSREGAIAIYREEWWDRYRYGELSSPGLAAHMLALAVNTGPDDAGRMLQKALNRLGCGVAEDGVVGSRTIAAANGTAQRGLLLSSFVEMAVKLYLDREGVHAEGLVRRAVAAPMELLALEGGDAGG